MNLSLKLFTIFLIVWIISIISVQKDELEYGNHSKIINKMNNNIYFI